MIEHIVNNSSKNKQIFHVFLFNIRNYSFEVINIVIPRVNNFDIKQKKAYNILLYANNTNQDLGR